MRKILAVLCMVLPALAWAGEANDVPKPGLPPGLIETFVPNQKRQKAAAAEVTCELWTGKCGERAACAVAGTLRSLVSAVADFDLRIDVWPNAPGVHGTSVNGKPVGIGWATVKGVRSGQRVKWKAMMFSVDDSARERGCPPPYIDSDAGYIQVVVEAIRKSE